MTNIFKTESKVANRDALFSAGIKALEAAGWTIDRAPGVGKSSVRRISKPGITRLASIKTTQDRYLAFSRTPDDQSWSTLGDVETVVVVSVDDAEEPRFAEVHIIDAADLIARFDRAYAARKAAGHIIPVGRGIWLALYEPEASEPVNLVGAGAGLKHPAVMRVPLHGKAEATPVARPEGDAPLTIPEAKRRLALTLGVPPEAIRITVEG